MTRRWTDEQLRCAIERSRSWRATARALGLKGTSAGVIRTIKRHTARLDLDTAHFTGQRRWSDTQLRDAVMRATTWTDVIRLLDISDDGTSRGIVKAHAIRLRLDTSHLDPVLVEDVCPTDLRALSVQPPMLRVAAASMAAAWFMLRGLSVAFPAEPEVYDLLVTMPDGVRRVQVKSTVSKGRSGAWEVGVGRRPYVMDKTAAKVPYDPRSIDYFFIVDGIGRMFLIPSQVLAGRVRVYIDSYVTYCVGDASSLLN